MNVSVLTVSIVVASLFICSSVANAKTAGKRKAKTTYVYNTWGNEETVYTLDKTGKLLTPKVKHETQKGEDGSMLRITYRWDADNQLWNPGYQLSMSELGNSTVLSYAAWDKNTRTFALNQQKAVYAKGLENEILSYEWFKWNHADEQWDVNQRLVFEGYETDSADVQ